MRLPGDGTAQRIISVPGSYYLTTNLAGVAGLNGISIRANNVTLDLNGFALVGAPGSLDGINATMPWRNVEIRSGNIENWGGDGVDTSLVSDGRFVNLRSVGNGANGLNLGTRSVVTECQASSNAIHGILVSGGVVKQCIAVANGFVGGVPGLGHGFFMSAPLGESDVIQHCVAVTNATDGINVAPGLPGRGAVIADNSTKNNLSDGIEVYNHCIIRGNNALANGGSGIHVIGMGTGNRIEENHLSLNPMGVLCDPPTVANLVIKNSSQGAGPGFGYVIPVPANHVAAITLFPGGGFVGAGPWTNFEY
jgi:hypothetical protein